MMPLLLGKSRPAPTPASHPPRKAVCGIRFWIPPGWNSTVSEIDGLCKVGLSSRSYPAREIGGQSYFQLWLEVYRGPFPDIANHWGFEQVDGKWKCYSQAETEAQPLDGHRTPGLQCPITFRSYDDAGHYPGQGDGEMAVLFGERRVVTLQARGAGEHFQEILRSIRVSD